MVFVETLRHDRMILDLIGQLSPEPSFWLDAGYEHPSNLVGVIDASGHGKKSHDFNKEPHSHMDTVCVRTIWPL